MFEKTTKSTMTGTGTITGSGIQAPVGLPPVCMTDVLQAIQSVNTISYKKSHS